MELEPLIWRQAASAYGVDLTPLIMGALDEFTRAPGFDDLTRMYELVIGHDEFVALLAALQANGHDRPPSPGIIEIRARTRWHLRTHLLRNLVSDDLATAQMRDALFACDLGL